MTDIDQTYKRLTIALANTRKTLQEACIELDIDIDTIDDEVLEHNCSECSNCGIWSQTHRLDEDGFWICNLCYTMTL